MQEQENFCPRHPSTETNLRCGRCGQLICPRCMVVSPVGARCPDCARIGRPAVMQAGMGDLGRAAVAAIGAGVVGGVAISLLGLILWQFPMPWFIPSLIAAMALMGSGVPVGELVRRAANRSMDTRVRLLAAFSVFLIYAFGMMLASAFGVSTQLFLNLFALIGMAMGVWTAMNRVRS